MSFCNPDPLSAPRSLITPVDLKLKISWVKLVAIPMAAINTTLPARLINRIDFRRNRSLK